MSLLKAKDSSLVKISVSNKDGRFEFDNIGSDKYVVMASAVGHSKMYSAAIDITESSNSVDLEPIALKTSSKELKEVTVVSRKPMIEQKN